MSEAAKDLYRAGFSKNGFGVSFMALYDMYVYHLGGIDNLTLSIRKYLIDDRTISGDLRENPNATDRYWEGR